MLIPVTSRQLPRLNDAGSPGGNPSPAIEPWIMLSVGLRKIVQEDRKHAKDNSPIEIPHILPFIIPSS